MSDDIAKMNRSLDKFNAEVKEFFKNKLPKEVIQAQKKLVLEALKRVVMRTPVDTGRARGNWQVTIARPSDSVIDAEDKTGSDTISKGLSALSALPPYQVVWISNNVDYIEFLEEGTSQQSPKGMVRLTVIELREMIRNSIK